MSSICTSNVTSGFIDLATFDEIEKYMYGGPDATAYFVRETRKSTWFTQVPVVLSRSSGGNADFGAEWSASISRAGDYLLQTWLRTTVSTVTPTSAALAGGLSFRWTRNLMHNLVKECCITFNDLVAARFDNYHLDFWAAFTVPAGKRNGYYNMIGDVPALYQAHGGAGAFIPQKTLNLPLPFFYGRDSGVALPTAALPYNDMRINFVFRDWSELLIQQAVGGLAECAVSSNLENVPKLTNTNVWANYAIVSNDERKRMACAPRDILIEQVQTAPLQTFDPVNNKNPSYDIRFSHAIKVLFFAARNETSKCEWSNYTSVSPDVTNAGPGGAPLVDFTNGGLAADPIKETSLIYENTARLYNMGSDYYSLVNPYYHAPNIPVRVGYHTYSYSLDFICLDPMGSTNYGKLTNVSINPTASDGAVTSAGPVGEGNPTQLGQKFKFVVTAVNNNIIRISGGALGKNGKPKIGRCFKSCGKTFRDKHLNYHSSISVFN
jgi:hypothetical protein